MTLAGTRPILQDELQKYELHHRARIAIKPGITGMWQVSGRSDITDFEEVVRLDTEYISNWTFIFFLYFEQFLDFRFTRRPYCLFIIVCYRSAVGASIRQFLSREAVAAGIAKVVVQVIFTPISNISSNAIMVGSSLPVSFINPV